MVISNSSSKSGGYSYDSLAIAYDLSVIPFDL